MDQASTLNKKNQILFLVTEKKLYFYHEIEISKKFLYFYHEIEILAYFI